MSFLGAHSIVFDHVISRHHCLVPLELQRSLEFEDSLSLLRSARSSSMQQKKGESSAKTPPPNTLGVSREPVTPIDDIVRLIEDATPTEGTVIAYVW